MSLQSLWNAGHPLCPAPVGPQIFGQNAQSPLRTGCLYCCIISVTAAVCKKCLSREGCNKYDKSSCILGRSMSFCVFGGSRSAQCEADAGSGGRDPAADGDG